MEAPFGSDLIITQVPDRNSEMLAWLRKEDILPGCKITLISKDKFGDSVVISLSNDQKRLAFSVANQIHVSLEADI